MTAAMSVEQQRARYAQAREALWGKPRIVNVAVEEKRAIEEHRKMQRQLWEQREEEAKERSQKIAEISRFAVTFQVSADLESDDSGSIDIYVDTRKVRPTMEQIARNVLAGYPGISMADIRSPCRTREMYAVRKRVVESIHRIRPDKKIAEIARFVNRDHTSLLYLLGRVVKKR